MTTERKKRPRRPSERASKVEAAAQGISIPRLKAFIESKDGVVTEMAKDRDGLRGLGLERSDQTPLSRMTLVPRLQAIRFDFDGKRISAHDYASIVRVRAGKCGPRTSRAAREAATATAADRAHLVETLARTSTEAEAARVLGVTRSQLVKRVAAFGIERQEIDARRVQIATCQGCASRVLGTDAPKAPHTCGK